MKKGLFSLALAVALLGAAPAAASGLVASASLQPRAVLFADVVHARVDVTVDAQVDVPATIEIATPLGNWAVLTRTSQTTSAGRFVRRRLELTIACRTSACVPTGASNVATLPAATVTVRTRGGRLTTAKVPWPPLVVASRLPGDATTAAKPPFQLDVAPPPIRPRVSAAHAGLLLDLAAALCALAALTAIVFELRGRRTSPSPSPLERALALAHEAQSRPVADRRRALALLARVAPLPDDELAAAAADTTWKAAGPSPEEVERIARQIEQAAPRPPEDDA
jgi:hypothetical protein